MQSVALASFSLNGLSLALFPPFLNNSIGRIVYFSYASVYVECEVRNICQCYFLLLGEDLLSHQKPENTNNSFVFPRGQVVESGVAI